MIPCCSNQKPPSSTVLSQVSPSLRVVDAEEHEVVPHAVDPAESRSSWGAAPFRLAIQHKSQHAVGFASGNVARPPQPLCSDETRDGWKLRDLLQLSIMADAPLARLLVYHRSKNASQYTTFENE